MNDLFKNIILFKICFLIIYLYSSVKSDNNIYNDSIDFNIDKLNEYTIKIPNNENKKYLKLEVKGNYSHINYILSFYQYSIKSKRVQLAQSVNGIAKLYISNNQIKNEIIYIDIECSNYMNSYCSGVINNKFYEKIELIDGEPFSYYVTDNIEMEFILNSNSSISNVWARGQFEIITELNIDDKIKYKNGNYYIVNNKMNNVNFKVIGKPGDYINVGYIGYSYDDLKFHNTKLIVDNSMVLGYLKKGYLENVCYELILQEHLKTNNYIFGTTIILTKIAFSFILYHEKEKLNQQIKHEIIKSEDITTMLNSNEIRYQKKCITFPNPNDFPEYNKIQEIVFNFQFLSGNSNENHYNIYEPQINGVFYPRILSNKSKVAFISQNNGEFEKMSLILMNLKGYSKMTIIDCNTFPLCSLDDDSLRNGISPRNINNFSTLTFNRNNHYDYSPISLYQKLIVVECKNSINLKNLNNICFFDSLIYKDDDLIELIEDNYFNQFTLKNEINNFKINLFDKSNFQTIIINIIAYIGEVEIDINVPNNLNFTKTYFMKQIYLIGNIKNISEKFEDLIFSIRGISNAFYTILVNLERNGIDDYLIKNDLKSGIPYLITIDTSDRKKIIRFKNEKFTEKIPIVVSFNPLNCDIKVEQIYKNNEDIFVSKEIKRFEQLSYDIIYPCEEERYSYQFEFIINIEEANLSQYKGQLCKIYASLIELNNEHQEFSKDILISDNSLQKIIFDKNIIHASFGYSHCNIRNDLMIKFYPKQTAQYRILIYFNYEKRENEEIIVSNDIIYLKYEEWENICNDINNICYIQLDISMENDMDNDQTILEFSIESVTSYNVAYIQKNIIRNDYVENNNIKSYYTELGENEKGFIIVNFLRGSGKMNARIVEENKDDKENGYKWRGKYILPNEENSIKMDDFTKKILFSTSNHDCKNGCYLLISIFSDVKDDLIPIDRIYPFSILVYSFKFDNLEEKPNIIAQLDEFIIGTLQENVTQDILYDYYYFQINSDSEQIIIDFQCNLCGLILNLGNTRPTINNFHYSYYNNQNSLIIALSKDDILEKWKKLGNISSHGLKNINIIIGIWTNMTDSIYTTLYAFIVRLDNGTENDIYKVNSDQKALCKSRKMKNNNTYRCIFSIEYNYYSTYNYLILYPKIQNNTDFIELYANYIDKKDYIINSNNNLIDFIPTKENYEYSNNDIQGDYLFITEGLQKNKYLLVSIQTNIETIIELLSSIYTFDNGLMVNPRTSQLFLSFNNVPIILKFPSKLIEIVNVRGIGGKAEIFWDYYPENKYYLGGREDILSISSEKSEEENKLIITARSNIKYGVGFFFIIDYDIRINDFIFDKLIIDKSVNFLHSNVTFPIIYYTPINKSNIDYNDYYDIFLNFYDLEQEIKILENYENDLLEINACIVNQETIYLMKLNPNISLNDKNNFYGIYDQALRIGFIKIKRILLDESSIHDIEKPYLLLTIKNNNKNLYKIISLEISIIKNKPDFPISELSYQFGSLEINEERRKYRLRKDKTFKYMIIQFYSEDLFSIKIQGREDLTLINDKYGRKEFFIEIKNYDENSFILVIEKKYPLVHNKTVFFMFKYSHSNNIKEDYSISNTTLEIFKIKNGKLSCYRIIFNPVDDYQRYKITYVIKFGGLRKDINDTDIYKPESEFIFFQDEKAVVKEYYNPDIENDYVNLLINNINPLFSFVQVIAKIRNKEIIEYLSYKKFDISKLNYETCDNETDYDNKTDDNNNNKSKNKTFKILLYTSIGVITILVIIILIVLFYNIKNKNLMNEVNKISFQKERDKDSSLLYEK